MLAPGGEVGADASSWTQAPGGAGRCLHRTVRWGGDLQVLASDGKEGEERSRPQAAHQVHSCFVFDREEAKIECVCVCVCVCVTV